MKISDARNTLKENKGKHLYDVIVPSTGKKIPFSPMTVGQHKTVAKMAIANEANFDKFLCALILELSNEQIKLNDINEIDKMAILYQIKQHNSPEALKITLTCPKEECRHEFPVVPKDVDVIKIDVDCSYIKKRDVGGIDFEIEIGMPSVQDSINYSVFCDARVEEIKASVEGESEEDKEDKEDKLTKLAIFIASYEMYLLCVKSIKMHGACIDDFMDSSISERFQFLDELSEGLIVVSEISEFINSMHEAYGYHVNCPKCDHEFDNLFTPESFFFY